MVTVTILVNTPPSLFQSALMSALAHMLHIIYDTAEMGELIRKFVGR